MSLWLWRFWIYSFLGCLLERAFAACTRSPRRRRRCFLLLPLCPVYGLGVLAVLALPRTLRDSFWDLAIWGGLVATAVEFGVHLFYERLLGVQFWDYRGVWGNWGGRICVPFSVAWSLLLALALPPAERLLTPLLSAIPPQATVLALLLFTADTVGSLWFLGRTHDVERLRAWRFS